VILRSTGAAQLCRPGCSWPSPLAPSAPTTALRVPASTPSTSTPSAASSDATAPGADIARFWRGFNDPVLTQLVERALGANGDVRIAQARLRESRALLQGARAELLPEVGASADVTRSRTPDYLQQPGSSGSQSTATVYDAGFTGQLGARLLRPQPPRKRVRRRTGRRLRPPASLRSGRRSRLKSPGTTSSCAACSSASRWPTIRLPISARRCG
jgi:hypothetical protein